MGCKIGVHEFEHDPNSVEVFVRGHMGSGSRSVLVVRFVCRACGFTLMMKGSHREQEIKILEAIE
tara:strand:+ start:749 stop:943 length:195 start_codon:yes stop_codon:yes gene_type:complete